MSAAAQPAEESRRLARLHALAVLDSAPEPLFDSLAQTAALAVGTPIAMLTLVDAERQWFKATVGMPGVTETPREGGFCAHTILGQGVLEVPDARADPRFAASPLVTSEPHIRFYAGIPLALSSGEPVGALCVVDRQPRQLDPTQRALLSELARATTLALEQRAQLLAASESQRQQLEAALTGNVRALNSILDLLPVAVSVWDREFCNVYANTTAARWLGGDAGSLPGTPLAALVGPRAMIVGRSRHRAVLDGQAQDFITTVPTSQGARDHHVRYVPHHGRDGEIDGFVVVTDDVTAQREAREAERALRESHESLRILYERTPGLLLSIAPDGTLLTVSDRWLQTFGFRRAEVIGRRLTDFVDPPLRALAESELLPRVGREGRADRVPLRCRTRDGGAVDVLLSSIVQTDRAGRPLRTLAVLEDVTEVLARSAELAREQSLREQVERHAAELQGLLAERGEMLNVLAHEVRQPLNNASAALQGAGALLSERGDAEAALRLARAQSVLRQVLDGVDNTLAVASLVAAGTPQAPADTDVDLDAMAALAVADLPPPDRPRITFDRQTRVHTATMDLGLMRLALRNLLGNALRHSPPGASVTLTLADAEEPPALLIDVSDRGSGIPADMLPRLFQRGARGAGLADRGRHGLGLYIVQRAMELQRGSAELLSTGAHGTTMRLSLPQALD